MEIFCVMDEFGHNFASECEKNLRLAEKLKEKVKILYFSLLRTYSCERGPVTVRNTFLRL